MWGNTFSKYLKLIFSILSYVNIEKYLVYPGSTCCTRIYSQRTQSSFLKYLEMSNAKRARNTTGKG